MTDLSLVHSNPTSRALTRERIAATTEAARRAGSLAANAGRRPVFPGPEAIAALSAFDRPLQDEPRTAFDVLRELDTCASPATTVTTAGRYFGFVTGGTLPAAAGAAILAGAWDNNAFPPHSTPGVAAVTEAAARWTLDALGLPSTATASFCAGATVANLTGIITARDTLLARAGWDVGEHGLAGAPALRVIVGEEAHVSVWKALRLAGFGRAQVESAPVDERGAIDASRFPSDTDALTLVVLQAGNVNTGVSDPFEAIIPGVRERGGWAHVDGAFGLWAAASPRLRHLVAGVELADSWGTDGHKWLNVPYDSGIVIVRDGDTLAHAMRAEAPYLAGAANPGSIGIQMSQRARGVEAWAALASLGRRGLAEMIERHSDQAALFAALLAEAGAELLVPPTLNQALVAFGRVPGAPGDDDVTRAVIAAAQAEGTCWPGMTSWRGRAAMRLSVSDVATTNDDIDASAASILACWESVRG